jgi:hypothetical protein
MSTMKPYLLAGLLLVAASCADAACSEKRSRGPQFVELAVPDGAPRPKGAEDFNFIDDTTTIGQLTAKVGPPDASDGDSVPVLVYCLPDGSEMRIGSRDGSTIEFVRHDGKQIFKRKKKK